MIHVSDFRLRAFKLVAEYKNYTMAAKDLRISQPAVYNHIRELESRYGLMLVERHGPRIVLTPAGELFLKQCNEILSKYEQLEVLMHTYSDKIVGAHIQSEPVL